MVNYPNIINNMGMMRYSASRSGLKVETVNGYCSYWALKEDR